MKKIFQYYLILWFLFSPGMVFSQNASLNELFQKGERAYQARNLAEAKKIYEQVIQEDSSYVPAYNALGLIHNEQGAGIDQVMWFFHVATQIDPQNTDAYAHKCKIYYDRGYHPQAEEACLKGLEINPGLLNLRFYLAWIYLLGKDMPAEAIIYFKQVLEKVQNPMFYYGLGMAYIKNGDNALALDVITRLRGLGEVDYAIQLEDSLRSASQPQKPPPPVESGMERTGQATLVGASAPAPVEVEDPSSVSMGGEMRIRLKGKLSSGGKHQTQSPAKHPGSL